MGINQNNISSIAGELRYQLPAFGSPSSDYVTPWTLEANGDKLVYQFGSLNPYPLTITLSQDVADYRFTPGGGADQIVIAVRGGGTTGTVTLVLPGALAQYISGGGYTGTGEIKLEGVSALYDPATDPATIAFFTFAGKSSFPVVSDGPSTIQLQQKDSLPLPSFNADGSITFDDSPVEIFPNITSSENPDPANYLVLFVVKANNWNGSNDGWINKGESGTNSLIRGGDGPLNDRGWGFTEEYFNGSNTAAGDVVPTNVNLPPGQPGIWIARGINSAGSAQLMGGGSGASVSRAREGDLFAVGLFQGPGVQADRNALIQRLLGWSAYYIEERTEGATTALSLLGPNNIYADSPPGEGEAGEVVATSPQVTITFSSIPSGWEGRAHQGSKTLKYESDITTGTFSYTPPAGEVVSYTFSKPGFLLERFDRAITQDQEIVLEPTPDPSWVEAS